MFPDLWYLDNGGHFSTAVLPASSALPASSSGATASEEACDADCDPPPPLERHRLLEPGFRLNSKAFMLTFNSRSFVVETWPVFRSWVLDKRRELGARRWSACVEEPGHAQPGTHSHPATVYHLHAYLWWTDGVGLRRRNTDDLVFDAVRPRVDVCTCQAAKGRTLRVAAAQGLWYVAVDKCGTVASSTNFAAWRDYVPKACWARSLWDANKLSNDMYAAFSLRLRSGHSDRKRDFAELEADERRQAVRDHVAAELVHLHEVGVFQPLRAFPEVDGFLKCFDDRALCRRPILAVVGGTNLGKSILAADVLKRVGAALRLPDFLEVTVEDDSFLDLTDLNISRYAGVLLDGVGDALVLKRNREVLQGRPKLSKAARSPTMRFSSLYTLCRRAVVATFDLSAANLDLLESDHWLSNSKNVVLLKLTTPAWVSTPAAPAAPAAPPPSPRDTMATWSADGVSSFARARDLVGPAAVLFASGVNGGDLLDLDEAALVTDVRLTPFAAQKLVRARDAYLAGR